MLKNCCRYGDTTAVAVEHVHITVLVVTTTLLLLLLLLVVVVVDAASFGLAISIESPSSAKFVLRSGKLVFLLSLPGLD